MYGSAGTGNPHLVIAEGVKACAMGLKTQFFTVTELVLKHSEACKQGILERLVMELEAGFIDSG